jgi:putative lipoic acid-binding regulatory protein
MTDRRYHPDELLSFPCQYEFKAFAAADSDNAFAASVHQAVNQVVPVAADRLRTRHSSGGRYQCVTVRVRLDDSTQLTAIYANLRGIAGLRYLL